MRPPLVLSLVPLTLVALALPACRLWGIGLPCDGEEDCPPAQICRGVCVDVDDAPPKLDAGPGPDAGPDVGEWYAAPLAFAVDVEVSVPVRATDLPIVVDLDPQSLLRTDAGADVVLAAGSLRVYEGATELPSRFFGEDGFGEDGLGQDGGLLVFALPGVTEPGTRVVRVYFAAQGDEPGVAPPAYWRDEVRENVAAAGVELVGLNVDGVGIVRKMQVGDSLFFMSHTTRLLADGPAAGERVSGGGYPAATDVLYQEPFGPPRVRLDEPSLVVVESVGDAVTATGAVRVLELLLAGPRPLALSVVRVDNRTGGPLSSTRLFTYLDPDVADAGDDDAAVTGNTVLVSDASPARILVAHDGAATALRVGLIHEMEPALHDGVVAGGSSTTALDVGVCAEWTLGALAPGAHATARHVFGLDAAGAASLEQARDELLSPTTTVGPLLRRPD